MDESSSLSTNQQKFLHDCSQIMNISQAIRQNHEAYMTFSYNSELFSEGVIDYDHSFSNPEYLNSLGFNDCDLISLTYDMLLTSLSSAILKRPLFIWDKTSVILALQHYFKNNNRDELQHALDQIFLDLVQELEFNKEKEKSTPDNIFNAILASANKDDLTWMVHYGTYISQMDKDMAIFWFNLEASVVDRLARHIVHAFLHGFISQSRKIAGRKYVRLVYTIGQEALVQKVVKQFEAKGFQVIILQPNRGTVNAQHIADHTFQDAMHYDSRCYEHELESFIVAQDAYAIDITSTCGLVKIGQFGSKIQAVFPSEYAYKPTSKTKKLYMELLSKRRTKEASLLPPDTLSFCSVVFPDMNIGERFKEIFDDFCILNTQESEPYELIQKSLIDLLDMCDYVHIKGQDGNGTDLKIHLPLLANPEKETKFLNCGGDLNIPHGELFTTPVLEGTQGTLHIKYIYLNTIPYKDLMLKFEDGRVVSYTCSVFGDQSKDEQYVFDNLLRQTEQVSMGEFSIGTNTLAYKIANMYDLVEQLPILLVEKMGPHIAIGDPCFARGEASPVYDLYTGKEMIARYNEITCDYSKNNDCYFNFHTDITIPFGQIGFIRGITADQTVISIMEQGRFIPEEAKKLNEYL
ncbi:MAG: aminopeptidase [Sphaerochaetaceae bacterium]|nr:aminopeptidase [Sphaerochaetaceae bacterium]MDD2404985.1 aminopeptidase [Sphaerochaetaceae bacterium]MDD4842169.1 aminopeptidase [Sphaerochaetaceae bacterium]